MSAPEKPAELSGAELCAPVSRSQSREQTVLSWTILLAVFLLTLPPLAELPQTGLDPSWKIGLHVARERGIVVGRDTFFTYGPWGFLVVPLVLTKSGWWASFLYLTGAHVLLFTAVRLWSSRCLEGWMRALAPLPLLLFVDGGHEYTLVIAFILGVRALQESDSPSSCLAAALGVMLAPLPLVKFSGGLAGMGTVIAATLAAGIGRKLRVATALTGGFLAATSLFCLVALGSWHDAAWFVQSSLEYSLAHQFALQRDGPVWQPAVFLIATLLFTAGMREVLRVLPRILALMLPVAALWAVIFKHAFGRHETHGMIAFAVGAPMMAWMAMEGARHSASRPRVLFLAAAALLVIAALTISPPAYLLHPVRAVSSNLDRARHAMADVNEPGFREQTRSRLRAALSIDPSLPAAVRDAPTDVLTSEISIVEAYGLNWAPRPFLMNYLCVTARFDDIEADFFRGATAPRHLLVALSAQDTRNPLSDSPGTWRQILLNYDFITTDSRWSLLSRRRTPRRAIETPIGRAEIKLNSPIPVPSVGSGGHIEAALRGGPSWLGKLVGVPWKTPRIWLGYKTGETTRLRRILPATAVQPFPITEPRIDTPDQLRELFEPSKSVRAPAEIAIVTDHAWAWSEPVEIEFYHVEWRE